MKKNFKLALFGFSILAFCGIACVANKNVALPVIAEEGEGEVIPNPEPIVETGTVVIPTLNHGKVVADKLEGNVGDIVTLNVTPSFLYLVKGVSVNGTNLVESANVKDQFEFALVQGENIVDVTFVIDEETLGVFTTMYEEAVNKDWTNLFSVENVITIVKWVLDGGILVFIARYFIKDKKLAKQVEENVKSSVECIIPNTTKETVISCVKDVVSPIFSQITANQDELMKAMDIFSKCMALSQENTPEARKAILDELSGLKIGDLNTISEVKAQIEQMIAKAESTYKETMEAIEKIGLNSKAIVEEGNSQEEKQVVDNGTQI